MSVDLDAGVYCLEWDKCWNFRPKAIGWGRRRGRPGTEIPDTGLSPAKDAENKTKQNKTVSTDQENIWGILCQAGHWVRKMITWGTVMCSYGVLICTTLSRNLCQNNASAVTILDSGRSKCKTFVIPNHKGFGWSIMRYSTDTKQQNLSLISRDIKA